METDLIPNVRGNVQSLRNMWSTKAQEDQKPLKPKATVYRSHTNGPRTSSSRQSIRLDTESSISSDGEPIHNYREPVVKFEEGETIINQKLPAVKFDNAETIINQKQSSVKFDYKESKI